MKTIYLLIVVVAIVSCVTSTNGLPNVHTTSTTVPTTSTTVPTTKTTAPTKKTTAPDTKSTAPDTNSTGPTNPTTTEKGSRAAASFENPKYVQIPLTSLLALLTSAILVFN
ncbi:integumentary mucin C.1-like isoform X1 [Octopus sinensis]|uniref:Integumentary mucin C.1-like isoform X1 n=1 Tax=Octopus sinensis TaxID=2607531 RepID=A0A6P7SJT3_9MOLL|nr:integumentary mucin C.1-like isoform X1 [Octopus sinensis]